MAKANLGVLEFLKSIAWEKSKQGLYMSITPQPVFTITIMSMLSMYQRLNDQEFLSMRD